MAKTKQKIDMSDSESDLNSVLSESESDDDYMTIDDDDYDDYDVNDNMKMSQGKEKMVNNKMFLRSFNPPPVQTSGDNNTCFLL